MELVLPALELASSALLQAAIDERFFRLWDFERDGAYPCHRAVKNEVEHHVETIERTNASEALLATAQRDRAFMRGSGQRGPRPYVPAEGTRPLAFRALAELVDRRLAELDAAALRSPSPKDRVCRVVPGLFDALSPRDGLLPIESHMVPDTPNHDRYLVVGDHVVFPHPAIRPARELVGDLWELAADGADVRIAVDPHRVVRKEDAQDVLLLDYWYGIKPTRADLDDLRGLARTRAQPLPPLDPRHRRPAFHPPRRRDQGI